MDRSSLSSQPRSHPSPEDHHRQQTAWQIWVPLGLLGLIVITLVVFTIRFTIGYLPEAGLPDQQSPLAKVSVIFLVSGVCFGSLFQLLVLFGLVILTGKIIKGTPGLAHNILTGVQAVASTSKSWGKKIASPLISLSALKAALKALLKAIQFWKNDTHSQ